MAAYCRPLPIPIVRVLERGAPIATYIMKARWPLWARDSTLRRPSQLFLPHKRYGGTLPNIMFGSEQRAISDTGRISSLADLKHCSVGERI
jgi:hypothetical protein